MEPTDDIADAELDAALSGFAEQVGEAAALAAASALVQLATTGPEVGEHLGDFRLGRELGRGGMGVVFEAEQISVPGRLVAVKVLRAAFASAPARQRFAREVAAIGRLDHPNIVPILAADVEASTPFFAMKRIDGGSLRDRLRTREFAGDVRRIVVIARDVALALQHAHDHGIVHRDVKPGNVLIDANGRAMLVDFGLALALTEDSGLTLTGDAVGTPDSMAPEQVDPRLGPVTARTDVYGLGAMLYECLALRPAFIAATRHEVLARIVAGDATPLRRLDRTIPRELETICTTAMQVEPARRYATAGAVAADLDAFLEDRPIQARPPGWTRRAQLLLRRHRVAVTAVALALLGFASAATYWGWIRPAQAFGVLLQSADDAWRRWQDVDQRLQARLAAERELLGQFPNTVPAKRLPALQLELQQLHNERLAVDRELESALEACATFNPTDPRGRRRHADFLARQLRDLLGGGGIVLRRDHVERCERRLRNLAETPEHRQLLDPASQLTVRSPVAASVWLCPVAETTDGRMAAVPTTAPTARNLGATPATALVPEGNYVLRAQATGFAAIELPLLLRRTTVQTEGEATVELEFLRPEQIGDGYRQVHAGYGVVFDGQTGSTSVLDRLVHHPGFLIAERELTRSRYET